MQPACLPPLPEELIMVVMVLLLIMVAEVLLLPRF